MYYMIERHDERGTWCWSQPYVARVNALRELYASRHMFPGITFTLTTISGG